MTLLWIYLAGIVVCFLPCYVDLLPLDKRLFGPVWSPTTFWVAAIFTLLWPLYISFIIVAKLVRN